MSSSMPSSSPGDVALSSTPPTSSPAWSSQATKLEVASERLCVVKESQSPMLSPLVFASPSQSTTSAKPGFQSRIIHRAASYIRPIRRCTDSGSDSGSDAPPPRKRPKLLRTQLAQQPASVRRAASLRSLHDDDDGEDKE
ncbi:hypothetical protein H0H87_000886, partial [Tephrocybe sp. NHM501043]